MMHKIFKPLAILVAIFMALYPISLLLPYLIYSKNTTIFENPLAGITALLGVFFAVFIIVWLIPHDIDNMIEDNLEKE